jgi:flagellar biosynthesis protein FliQ
MTPQMALDLAYGAIILAAKLSAPVLISTMIIGVVVNILQTVLSIKDMSMSFIPKIAGAAVVMGFAMPWAVNLMSAYFEQIYMMFKQVAP